MAYFIDLFSPETYQAFAHSSRDISGFRLRHRTTADRISPGDLTVCKRDLIRAPQWAGARQFPEELRSPAEITEE